MEHPDCKGWDEPHPDCTFKKRPYSPTLSELIDAIGMIVLFYSPGDNMRDKGWYAAEGWLEVDGYYKPSEGARKTKNGATPEEAVANLYLALHNK